MDGLGKELQGHVPLQALVARQPDNAHASTAENMTQRVASKNLLADDEPLNGCAKIEILRNGCHLRSHNMRFRLRGSTNLNDNRLGFSYPCCPACHTNKNLSHQHMGESPKEKRL